MVVLDHFRNFKVEYNIENEEGIRHPGKQGPRTLEDPREPRTLEDPGTLRTQDPRGPRTLKDPGILDRRP